MLRPGWLNTTPAVVKNADCPKALATGVIKLKSMEMKYAMVHLRTRRTMRLGNRRCKKSINRSFLDLVSLLAIDGAADEYARPICSSFGRNATARTTSFLSCCCWWCSTVLLLRRRWLWLSCSSLLSSVLPLRVLGAIVNILGVLLLFATRKSKYLMQTKCQIFFLSFSDLRLPPLPLPLAHFNGCGRMRRVVLRTSLGWIFGGQPAKLEVCPGCVHVCMYVQVSTTVIIAKLFPALFSSGVRSRSFRRSALYRRFRHS